MILLGIISATSDHVSGSQYTNVAKPVDFNTMREVLDLVDLRPTDKI